MKIELRILDKEFYQVNKMGGSYYDTPEYQTLGAGAMDLRITEDVTLFPGEVRLVGTGIAIHIKDTSILGVVSPRSGLGHKKGLVLGNLQGWIDSDYTGEIMLSLWNRNSPPDPEFINCEADEIEKYEEVTLRLKAGDRVAQIAFFHIERPIWEIVEDFNTNTQRGEMGFGSTGR